MAMSSRIAVKSTPRSLHDGKYIGSTSEGQPPILPDMRGYFSGLAAPVVPVLTDFFDNSWPKDTSGGIL